MILDYFKTLSSFACVHSFLMFYIITVLHAQVYHVETAASWCDYSLILMSKLELSTIKLR